MKVCLLSNEMYPFLPGGIGRLMYNFCMQNAKSKTPVELHYLLKASSADEQSKIREFYEGVAHIHFCPELADLDDEVSKALAENNAFHPEFADNYKEPQSYYQGLLMAEAASQGPFDVVEIADMGGWGQAILAAKQAGLAFQDTQIACRLHSSIGIITEFERYSHHPSTWFSAKLDLERQSILGADIVVGHVPAIVEENARHYNLGKKWANTVLVEFPPILLDTDVEEVTDLGPTPDFVFSSRLQPFKRPDIFIRAAVLFMERHPDYPGVFRIMSYGWDENYIVSLQALVPLSNFVTRTPVPKLGQINRVDQSRYFRVMAAVTEGTNAQEETAKLIEWLETEAELPDSITWKFTGDTEDQAETQAFLGSAFLGALGLMFVILLAQFNSFYNSSLVLLAVVLSTTGVLIGMLVMDQAFSMIMTGTGVVALAGIVVNNNIVLIDTYDEFKKYLPSLEAITRTAEARIRPVLLTTITTMAGLAPMMFGLSLDFINGGFSIDAPTALWWKQLATAVVFGLGIATVLTLVITPALLSLPVWISRGAYGTLGGLTALVKRRSQKAEDRRLRKRARKTKAVDVVWDSEGTLPATNPE